MLEGFDQYQLKLATLREYEDAIKWKRMYEEVATGFMNLIGEALNACERNGLPLSERDKYLRMCDKGRQLVERRMSYSPNESKQGQNPNGDYTEPPQ